MYGIRISIIWTLTDGDHGFTFWYETPDAPGADDIMDEEIRQYLALTSDDATEPERSKSRVYAIDEDGNMEESQPADGAVYDLEKFLVGHGMF
ncbi:MAG: hypothetical protein HQL75_00175 [Magnetococcales bacterium]|nr:hypothetical protein [Magnetococcales bacterium]